MALPPSGVITLSMVAVELGRTANAAISLNETTVRTLFGKPSGIISLADGYGKSFSRNYATLDPANKGSNITLSNGNLTMTVAGATSGTVVATQRRASGKFYIEVVSNYGSGGNAGLARDSTVATDLNYGLSDTTSMSYCMPAGYFSYGGQLYVGTGPGSGVAVVQGEVVGLAFDLTAGSSSLTAYTNAGYTTYSSSLLAAGYAAIGSASVGYTVLTVNFGATAFARTVPSGFDPGLFI